MNKKLTSNVIAEVNNLAENDSNSEKQLDEFSPEDSNYEYFLNISLVKKFINIIDKIRKN